MVNTARHLLLSYYKVPFTTISEYFIQLLLSFWSKMLGPIGNTLSGVNWARVKA